MSSVDGSKQGKIVDNKENKKPKGKNRKESKSSKSQNKSEPPQQPPESDQVSKSTLPASLSNESPDSNEPASEVLKSRPDTESESESIGHDFVVSSSSSPQSQSENETVKESKHPKKLPDSVTVLECPDGGKVYLVGTAHFSEKSCKDVEEVIARVKPNVIVLELCKNRMHILEYDEKSLLKEIENLSFSKLAATIRQSGLTHALLTMCFLSMTAQMTKKLGMFPGGEFRTAFREAKKIPGVLVHLGDRPINVTLSRGFASLRLWQKMRLAYSILANSDDITPEEVEKCKEEGPLGQMLSEMAEEYPTLSKIFIDERNTFLAYSLQLAASPIPNPEDPTKLVPATVVGVVGIGHVAGITERFGKVTDDDVTPLLSIPEPSVQTKIIGKSIKVALISMVAYTAYKFLIPRSFKEMAESLTIKTGEMWQQFHRR